jgi:hypothetical protein
VRSYWENVGEHIGEFEEHVGTHWNNKIQHPFPAPEEKQPEHPGCMLAHVIGGNNYFFLPVFFAIFSLAYWMGHELWVYSQSFTLLGMKFFCKISQWGN